MERTHNSKVVRKKILKRTYNKPAKVVELKAEKPKKLDLEEKKSKKDK